MAAPSKKPPVTRTKEEHGSKEKLVDRLVTLLGQIKEQGDKDELKARLLAASNKKLLRLLEIGTEIKDKFGSFDKLADATAKALGRAKDAPYLDRLKALTPARLLELFRQAEKQEKRGKAA